MQPFCFFAAAKEVGVWGLAPQSNKNIKTEFYRLKIFSVFKTIIFYNFFVVLFPAARGADFVKRTKKCKCFSFVCLKYV